MKTLRRSAFTLVEMLVVMGVMIAMIALITPAALQILRGSSMTQSGEMVGDQFVLARQAALTSNHRVQVRLYQLPITSASATWNFCAIQSFRVEDTPGLFTALTKLQLLRPGIIFAPGNNGAAGNTYSTLTPPLGSAPNYVPAAGTWTVFGFDQLPAYNGQMCYYVGFNFLPNGSTDLDPTGPTAGQNTSGGWFVTLLDANLPLPANAQPKNFYTIRVDPLLGHTQVFRP